eukprot:6933635-Alexandrium_andersonii.AAC.1
MVETTSTGFPPGEPEALEGLGVQRLPAGRGGPRAIETASELGARARPGHFGRERYIRIRIDIGTQVSFARVNEESFPGPTATAASATTPTGCQVR